MGENPVEIKICGIRDKEHLKACIDADVDYIGFIFVRESSRYIDPQQAADLVKDMSQQIRPKGKRIVAVLADPSDKELANVLRVLSPDILQLHGSETRERVREIGGLYDIRIMKALAIENAADIETAQSYVGYADILLFDARGADGQSGGTGTSFDWNLLKDTRITLPWFLSGGLNSENVEEAIRITGAKKVDVSSGVESSRGQKDIELITNFVSKVKVLSDNGTPEDRDD